MVYNQSTLYTYLLSTYVADIVGIGSIWRELSLVSYIYWAVEMWLIQTEDSGPSKISEAEKKTECKIFIDNFTLIIY